MIAWVGRISKSWSHFKGKNPENIFPVSIKVVSLYVWPIVKFMALWGMPWMGEFRNVGVILELEIKGIYF